MANQDRIDSMVDVPKVQREFDVILGGLDKIQANLEELDSFELFGKSKGSVKDAASAFDRLNKVMSDNDRINKSLLGSLAAQEKQRQQSVKSTDAQTKSNKAQNDTIDKLEKAKRKLADAESYLSKRTAEVNQQISEQNKLNAIDATLTNAVPGSLEEAAAKVAKYRNELNILNLTTATGKTRQKELITAIDEENKFIDSNSDALARQKINIGNYESALQGLGKSIKGFGGLARIIGQAIGVDPVIGETLHSAGKALVDLAHAYGIEKVAKTESTTATAAFTLTQTESNAAATAMTGTMEGQTIAVEANAVASEEAATKTGLLAKAMQVISELPIIVILLGIATAIVAISAALDKQSNKFLEVSKAAKDYAEDVSHSLENAQTSADIVNKSLQDQKKALEDQLAAEKLKGITQERELALLGKIAGLKKEISNNDLKANPKINDDLVEQIKLRDEALEKQKEIDAVQRKLSAEALADARAGKTDNNPFGGIVNVKDIRKDIKEAADANRETLNAANANIARIRGIKRDQVDSDEELLQNQLSKDRLNADKRRKLALAEAEIEYEIVQGKNARILSDEESTHKQRLAAITSNAAAENKLEQARLQDTLDTPGLSNNDADIARRRSKSKQDQIDLNSLAEREKETRDFNKKLLDLDNALAEAKAQQQLQQDKEAIDNDKTTYIARLEAAKRFYDDSLALLNQQRDQDLKQADTLPDDEQRAKKKLAIEQKYNADVLKLTTDNQKQIVDLTKAHVETINSIRKLGHDTDVEDIQNRFNEELTLENKNYLIRIKRDKGNTVQLERDRIEHERNVQRILEDSLESQLRADIAFAEKELAIEKARVEAEPQSDQKVKDLAAITKAEADLAGKKIALDKAVADNALKTNADQDKSDQDLLEKRIQRLQKLANYSKQVFDIIGGFVNASVQRELNGIQDQMDYIDKKKDKDIEAADQSIADEQKKAAAIQTITLRAAAQQDVLNTRKRQAQERQARFEKVANIASLTQETALAVVRALGDKTLPGPARIAEAVIIGALGLAQVAVAIATPIPRYKDGTPVGGHPYDGLAVVGDGGRPERVTLPDGTVWKSPATATVVDLPKGSLVENFPLRDGTLGMAVVAGPDPSKAIKKMGESIVMAIKGKTESHYYNMPRYKTMLQNGHNFRTYVNSR